jgi:hypothetical protein
VQVNARFADHVYSHVAQAVPVLLTYDDEGRLPVAKKEAVKVKAAKVKDEPKAKAVEVEAKAVKAEKKAKAKAEKVKAEKATAPKSKKDSKKK